MTSVRKYSLFIVFLLLSFTLINFFIVKEIQSIKKIKPSATSYKKNYTKSNLKADVLILGNSMTKDINLFEIKGKVINASTNSNTATEYLNDLMVLQEELSKGATIILTLTPFVLTREYYKMSLKNPKAFLLNPLERISKDFTNIIYPIRDKGYFYKLLNNLFVSSVREKPIISIDRQSNNQKLNMKFKKRKLDKSKKFKTISKLDLEAIKEISNIAKTKKWKVLYLTPPYHSNIISNTKEMLENILKKLDLNRNNIINLTELLLNNPRQDEFFYNSTHLNRSGLKILAERLNNAINLKLPQ